MVHSIQPSAFNPQPVPNPQPNSPKVGRATPCAPLSLFPSLAHRMGEDGRRPGEGLILGEGQGKVRFPCPQPSTLILFPTSPCQKQNAPDFLQRVELMNGPQTSWV